MIDSIFVAMSGMQGHQRGLGVLSNNVANMNTPGFRGSSVTFADVFVGAEGGGSAGQRGVGGGLSAALTTVDLRAGEAQQTGNDLDLRLEGAGFFIVQDESGALFYTRKGSFDLNENREVVVRGTNLKVMGRNAAGQLVPVEVKSLGSRPHKATSEVVLENALSPSDSDSTHTLDGVVVYDKLGGKHTLKLEFKKESTSTATEAKWTLQVYEGTTELGTGALEFIGGGVPKPGSSPLRLTLALKDAEPSEIAFDFAQTTGANVGTASNLGVRSQDGSAAGQISKVAVDEKGVVKVSYSNGDKADGPKLVVAVFGDEAQLVQAGNSLFDYHGDTPPTLREGGDDLKVKSGSLERSNVDLTEEFSELILLQRGYQASSQVVSTANEMLQELLGLRGRR
jgi:flagellar hook protein FlgE